LTHQPLEDLVRSHLDLRWHLDPVEASGAGRFEFDDRLGSFGVDDVQEHLAAMRSLANALEELSLDTLDDEIDCTALLNQLRATMHVLEHERPHVRNPEFWVSHVFEGLHLLLLDTDRPLEHRKRAAASRVAQIPALLAAAEETLADCPAPLVDVGLSMLLHGQGLLDEVGAQLGLDGDPGFVAGRDGAHAAMRGLEAFLEANRSSWCGDVAIGEESFEHRLQFEHACGYSAAELFKYGSDLATTVRAELDDLARQIDGKRSWPDVLERLRETHPSASSLVGEYGDAMERARRFLQERQLVSLPEGQLDIVETPPFLIPLVPFAAYRSSGAFSPSASGVFYVSAPSGTLPPTRQDRLLRDHCSCSIAPTAVHEGYPGHHVHFLSARRQPRLLRQFMGTPVTYEGWALYCEEMMGEQGFYESPEERFFQRVALLWRVVRIALDVGVHTMKLSYDAAVQTLVDHLHISRSAAESEVRRCCAQPTTLSSYAVGRRELLHLRRDYRASAGGAFTPRDFHDTVLDLGGLPISLMRWAMGL
jgi:hypothetical protein